MPVVDRGLSLSMDVLRCGVTVRGCGAGLRCRVAVQGLGWLSGQGGHAEAMSDKKVTRRRYQTKGHAEARKVRGGLQQLGKETDTELLGS